MSYVVVATGRVGGIAEELRAVPNGSVIFDSDHMTLRLSQARTQH